MSLRSGVGARGLERDGSDDPRDPEPDARGEHGSEQPVDGPQAGQPERRTGMQAEPFEAAGEHATREQRPDEAEDRRVLRAGATGQEQRPDPGAEKRSEGETNERQHADDEPLDVAVEGEQQGEYDDQPIDRCHDTSGYGPVSRSLLGAPSGAAIFYRSELRWHKGFMEVYWWASDRDPAEGRRDGADC